MKKDYNLLIKSIEQILEDGRKHVYYAVNSILVKTYWEIGRNIVEYEQKGKEKADYGSSLLNKLAKDLKLRYGTGLNLRNIYLMRKLYLSYRILQTVSAKLSWSHYVEIIDIEDNLELTNL